MGYVTDSLLPDEDLLVYGTPHWYTLVPSGIVLFGGVALMFAVGQWWGAPVVAVGLLLLVKAVLARFTTENVVTSRRVIVRSGIWRSQTIELEHKNIESFVIEQSLLGRLLNYGTLIVNGVGGARIPLEGLAKPGQFRRAALQAEEQLRLSRDFWSPHRLEKDLRAAEADRMLRADTQKLIQKSKTRDGAIVSDDDVAPGSDAGES